MIKWLIKWLGFNQEPDERVDFVNQLIERTNKDELYWDIDDCRKSGNGVVVYTMRVDKYPSLYFQQTFYEMVTRYCLVVDGLRIEVQQSLLWRLCEAVDAHIGRDLSKKQCKIAAALIDKS